MHQKVVAAWECTRLAEKVQDQQYKAINSSPLNIRGAKQDNWDPGHLDIWWHSSSWIQQYSTEIKTGCTSFFPGLCTSFTLVLLSTSYIGKTVSHLWTQIQDRDFLYWIICQWSLPFSYLWKCLTDACFSSLKDAQNTEQWYQICLPSYALKVNLPQRLS